MVNPYFLMVLLYLFVAILAALDASFASFTLVPWFQGIRWLRIHFITLGMVTEMLFGVLPVLVAARMAKPRPKIRWDIWGTLNVGLVVLLAGIPSINGTLILTGGTLIFIAATLLAVQLWQMRSHEVRTDRDHNLVVWASIFILPWQNILHGTAYALYVISMVPVALHLGNMVQGKFVEMNQTNSKTIRRLLPIRPIHSLRLSIHRLARKRP